VGNGVKIALKLLPKKYKDTMGKIAKRYAVKHGINYSLNWFRWRILFLWLNGMIFPMLGNTAEVDSLIQILPTLKGKEKVEVLNRITWKLRKKNLDSALQYGEKAIPLAEKLGLKKELARANNFVGVIFRNKGNYIYALNHFYQALQIAEKEGFILETAYSYNNIGDILSRQGKNKEAGENIEKAIEFFDKAKDKRGKAYGYIRLGEVYQADSLYDKALEKYRECLRIRIEEIEEDIDGLQSIRNRIGQIYNLTQKYDSALQSYWEALRIAQEIGDKKGISGNTADIAIVYKNLEKYDSAIYFGEKALDVALEVGVAQFIQKSTGVLAELYARKEQGNFQRAYELAKLFSDAQTELIREENQKILLSLQTEYQIQKQQSEIELLNKNKHIQQLVMGALVVGLVLLASWLFSMRKAALLRKENYKRLEEQKNEIETQAESLAQANNAINAQKFAIEEKNATLEDTLQKLKTAQTKIAEAEKMASLGQMVAGIAHELNNPINFVYAGTESLQTILEDITEILEKYEEIDTTSTDKLRDLQEEIRELKEDLEYEEMKEDVFQLLADIHNGATRTTEIVTGLRTFARMDSKQAQSNDIHQNLDSTLVILNHKIEERIDIHKNYDRDLPFVTCFPGQLNQVFMNILSNAIQAIQERGEIHIETQRLEGEQIQILISDNGKGMDKKTQESIFKPFFTTKAVGEGQGLGLAITAEIVERHHGKIEVESQENQGTTFKVILPIQAIQSE